MLPDSTVFATFSNDGTTKLWDVQKLEGRNLINKARMSYTQLGMYNIHILYTASLVLFFAFTYILSVLFQETSFL